MVKLTNTFNKLKHTRIMVLGDFFLDTYTIGDVQRISPEAPVPVLLVKKENSIAGGAGNVVLNIQSLGSTSVTFGRIGNDIPGKKLQQSLIESGADIAGLICEENYSTPVKNRILADNQQIIRVDHEEITPLSSSLEEKILSIAIAELKNVSCVIISDYAKGFLSDNLLSTIIHEANKAKLPIIVDPKGSRFAKYRGCSIIKPNHKEAVEAAKLPAGYSLDDIAAKLIEITDTTHLIITQSSKGIALYNKKCEKQEFQVRAREVKDVTGAGDTVLATMAIAISSGLSIEKAIRLSNITAGIAVEHIGCAKITLSDLANQLLKIDYKNKIFDSDNPFAIQHALGEHPYTILAIHGEIDFNDKLFKSIRQISNNSKLIVSLDENKCDNETINLLASLAEVDFIIVNEKILKCLSPKSTYELNTE
jgi:D-glycero-beta-D-manno-heptose-7-phosphate kinase